jgi:hypothetical protein
MSHVVHVDVSASAERQGPHGRLALQRLVRHKVHGTLVVARTSFPHVVAEYRH